MSAWGKHLRWFGTFGFGLIAFLFSLPLAVSYMMPRDDNLLVPISRLDDLKGLKIRTPPKDWPFNEIFKDLGKPLEPAAEGQSKAPIQFREVSGSAAGNLLLVRYIPSDVYIRVQPECSVDANAKFTRVSQGIGLLPFKISGAKPPKHLCLIVKTASGHLCQQVDYTTGMIELKEDQLSDEQCASMAPSSPAEKADIPASKPESSGNSVSASPGASTRQTEAQPHPLKANEPSVETLPTTKTEHESWRSLLFDDWLKWSALVSLLCGTMQLGIWTTRGITQIFRSRRKDHHPRVERDDDVENEV